MRKSPDFSARAVNSVGDNPALSASAFRRAGYAPAAAQKGASHTFGANVEINQVTAVFTGIGER
ncbi:hypothetical protein DMI60_09395 [Escherichia coli]|nr:hypothetical protein [Escherichia coli]